MKRIKTIVFVFVPVYIAIARTRVPKPAVVVSSQDRHLKTRAKHSDGRTGLGKASAILAFVMDLVRR